MGFARERRAFAGLGAVREQADARIVAAVHHAIEHWTEETKDLPGGGVLSVILPSLTDGVLGVIAGTLALGAVTAFQRARHRFAH